MTNTVKLKASLVGAGLIIEDAAKAIGLTYTGFWNKLHNKNEFKSGEIKALQSLLNLSDNEVIEIFFAEKSD